MSSKRCQRCGATYTRGRREAARDWDVRKYCGLPCAYQDRYKDDPEERRQLLRKYSPTNDPKGCWSVPGRHTGYPGFKWKNRVVRGNRLAYALFIGPIPPGQRVLHRCDNRKCVNPDHLFLGTAKDNTADMMKKGRHNPGVPDNTKKLSERDVVAIARSREPAWALAKKYGISAGHVNCIRTGKAWSRLTRSIVETRRREIGSRYEGKPV